MRLPCVTPILLRGHTTIPRILVIVAAALVLSAPAALGSPPEDKGKPEKPGHNSTAQGASDEKNAAKRCTAERERIGAAAFAAKYGTNANKANAFGKCVSSQAKSDDDESDGADDAEKQQAKENAAKKCKKLRADMGVAKFRETYGTNVNGANAFGKCVSKHARKLLES